MDKKGYYRMATLMFILAGSLHLYRATTQTTLRLNGIEIPMWVSWLLVIIAYYLAYVGWYFFKKTK